MSWREYPDAEQYDPSGGGCPECGGSGYTDTGTLRPLDLPCPLCSPLTKDRRAENDPRAPQAP